MRSIGIEEELLLVHPGSGCPLPVAHRVLDRARERETRTGQALDAWQGGRFAAELQQQQLEIRTKPRTDLDTLADDLLLARRHVIAAAPTVGARVVAVGTSPMPVEPRLVRTPRYEEMATRFGITTDEHLTCGCHLHVSVTSGAEAVAVLDRIRAWLPALLAISANSPYWQGRDTGFASYRAQAIGRWPCSGPTDVFGSAAQYHRLVSGMVACGVLLDEGMVYFDARLSHRYPTVEIRIADVCLDVRDAVLLAALGRALVDTAARAWAIREPAPRITTTMLRMATWQASRYGLTGALLDPYTARPRPAAEVLALLLDHLREALRLSGDERIVEEGLERIITHGNGAQQQRSAVAKIGLLPAALNTLAQLTREPHR